MLNLIKRLALWLALTLFGALPPAAPVVAPAVAAGTVATIAAPVVTPAALVGATAIVAALAEEPQAATIYALNWDKDNTQANSDIRLKWDGSNLLSRTAHTAIWRYNPRQQTGYYVVAWHSPNTGSWDGGAYSFGTHPWPGSDCATNANGQALNGTGSSGTAHCWEVAGTGGAVDWLISGPGLGSGTGITVTKDIWYVQARRVRTGGSCGSDYEHSYFPDLLNNPSQVINVCLASITGAGSTPAFYFGSSDWSASGSTNEETLGGKLRGIQLYSTGLSDADIATEAANITSNTPQTSAGISNVWYMNQNPRPSDVTDKSGAGHDPSWVNANRPTEWDSTVAGGGVPGGLLMRGVGGPR